MYKMMGKISCRPTVKNCKKNTDESVLIKKCGMFMRPKYASLRNKQQTTPTLKIQTRVRYANIRNSNFLEKKHDCQVQ